VHAVESVVIDWTHQIREVLKKDSAQPLLEGLNPVPYVEMEFWKVKAQNLECIYDQARDSPLHSSSSSRSSLLPKALFLFLLSVALPGIFFSGGGSILCGSERRKSPSGVQQRSPDGAWGRTPKKLTTS